VDEVFKIHRNHGMRGIKETQKLKLGDAQGIPPFFFNNYQLVSVVPKFLLVHMMCAILGCFFVLFAV
jgi:hypothetical protein